MKKVRVTKEFHFEMAHALWNYDGACKNIHGHSYKLFVTLIGEPITDQRRPQIWNGYGFYGSESKWSKDQWWIILIIHWLFKQSSRRCPSERFEQMYEKVHLFDFQPTCENLVLSYCGKN